MVLSSPVRWLRNCRIPILLAAAIAVVTVFCPRCCLGPAAFGSSRRWNGWRPTPENLPRVPWPNFQHLLRPGGRA
jgi:hypothetical protein